MSNRFTIDAVISLTIIILLMFALVSIADARVPRVPSPQSIIDDSSVPFPNHDQNPPRSCRT